MCGVSFKTLPHFENKPSINEVMNIDGFAEISARSYIENYDRFYDFIKDLPITIEKRKEILKLNNNLSNFTFVFTGIRLKEEEEQIIKMGGKIGTSVTKNTTHLICKDPNSGSSKLIKAFEMGVKIMGIDDFKNFLNNLK